MKQVYSKFLVYSALFTTLSLQLPTSISAQCNCPNGETPSTIVHQRNITTSMEETVLNFPQFNPEDGTLVCTNVNANITAITRIRIENDEIFAADYKINYSRTSTISGPGLDPTLVSSFSKGYGPYHLAESDGVYFSGPDYYISAKDTVLNKKQLTRTISGDITAFLGTGTVSYTYNLSTLSRISGGGNYLGGPLTSDMIDFSLTYTYCPMAILSTGIKDFSATRLEGDLVSISWIGIDNTEGTLYSVEMSENNRDFSTLENFHPVNTPTYRYQYLYNSGKQVSDKLYFRIKKTSIAGTTVYSAVKAISVNSAGGKAILYPNPAQNQVQLEFQNAIKGGVLIEVLGTSGQVEQKQQLQMNNSRLTRINLHNIKAGVYFLRTTDQLTGRKYFSRLVVK